MPIENFNYLDSLVPDNPVISDGVNAGATHIRGIKLSLKNTFAKLTGAVTATHDELNGAAGFFKNGTSIFADTGAFFKTTATTGGTGFTKPTASTMQALVAGNPIVTYTYAGVGTSPSLAVLGSLSASGPISGPGMTPIGGSVLWFDDILPSDNMWVWANGAVISNANIVCPVLLARWGNRFGGNGITSMGLPDLRETVPIGKSQMGGVAPRGAIGQYTPTQLNTINNVIGEAVHALTVAETPSHRHGILLRDPGHNHTYTRLGGGLRNDGTSALTVRPAELLDNTSVAYTGIVPTSGDGFDNATGASGGNGGHNNIQFSTVCNFIIRIG